MKVNNGWITFRTDRTSKPSHDLHNHLHKRWQRTWDNAKKPLKRSLCLDDMCPSIYFQARLMCCLKNLFFTFVGSSIFLKCHFPTESLNFRRLILSFKKILAAEKIFFDFLKTINVKSTYFGLYNLFSMLGDHRP
jgi:hypothetical protein